MSTTQCPFLAGLVIAGGSSSRMGRDKFGLPLGHETWWERQARILRAAGARTVMLSRRAGQAGSGELPCIQDLYTDIGPLAGLHAALRQAPAPLLAILAVDMPLVSPAWFEGLLSHCSDPAGAVYSHAGFLEPLAAIYPSCALPLLQAQIDAGHFSLQALGRRLAAQGLLRVLPLPDPLAGQSVSLNTPESLRLLGP